MCLVRGLIFLIYAVLFHNVSYSPNFCVIVFFLFHKPIMFLFLFSPFSKNSKLPFFSVLFVTKIINVITEKNAWRGRRKERSEGQKSMLFTYATLPLSKKYYVIIYIFIMEDTNFLNRKRKKKRKK